MLSKFVITESCVVRPNFFIQTIQQDMFMFFIIFIERVGIILGRWSLGILLLSFIN